jgi:hypothetical protein
MCGNDKVIAENSFSKTRKYYKWLNEASEECERPQACF